MKKRSLLALSMVSLVALVGCNQNGGGSKPKKSNDRAICEYIADEIFGKGSDEYVEDLREALPDWADEDAKSESVLALEFVYDEEFTPEDLNADLLYEALFVGYVTPDQEEVAPIWDSVMAKYGEQSVELISPQKSKGTYLFGYDFYCFEKDWIRVYGQFADFSDPEEGDGMFFILTVSDYDFSADRQAAVNLSQSFFGELYLVCGMDDGFLPASWADPDALSESIAYYEFDGMSLAEVAAKFFGSRPGHPSEWDQYAEEFCTMPYTYMAFDEEEGYGMYFDYLSEKEAVAYYFQAGEYETNTGIGTYLIMVASLYQF